MAVIVDILADENSDLMLGANGDFAIGDCRADMIERLVNAVEGEFKFNAELGVGMVKAIGGSGNINSLTNKLIEDMKRSNISYEKIEVSNGQLNITL